MTFQVVNKPLNKKAEEVFSCVTPKECLEKQFLLLYVALLVLHFGNYFVCLVILRITDSRTFFAIPLVQTIPIINNFQ